MNSFKLMRIMLILLVLAIAFAIGAFYFTSTQSKKKTGEIPVYLKPVPTLPPDKGLGVDTNSDVVKVSKTEIAKILPSLPYEDTIKTSEGLTVSATIPEAKYQHTTWTLNVYFVGINFDVQPTDKNYTLQKTTFLKSVGNIYKFAQDHKADPNKILFVWGDSKIERDQAKKWLSGE